MNTKYLVIVAALVLFAGVAFYVWKSGSPVAQNAREILSLTQDVAPVALSASEQKALTDAGFVPAPAGADAGTAALQNVYSSDRISSIDTDLANTDLSGLDAEA